MYDQSDYDVQFKARLDNTLEGIVGSYMSRQGYTASGYSVYKIEGENKLIRLRQNTLGESGGGVEDEDNLYIAFN